MVPICSITTDGQTTLNRPGDDRWEEGIGPLDPELAALGPNDHGSAAGRGQGQYRDSASDFLKCAWPLRFLVLLDVDECGCELGAELFHVEVVVGTSRCHQLIVRAHLEDSTAIEGDDGVGMANR